MKDRWLRVNDSDARIGIGGTRGYRLPPSPPPPTIFEGSVIPIPTGRERADYPHLSLSVSLIRLIVPTNFKTIPPGLQCLRILMFQVVAVRGPQFFLRSHTQRARHLRKVAAYHHHRSRSSSCRKPSTSMSLYSSSGASSGATGSSHHQIMRSSGATAADATATGNAAAAAASVNTTPSPAAPPPPPRSWTTRKTTSSLPGAQLRLRLVPKKDDFYQHYRQARAGGGGDSSKGSSKQLITDYSSGASLSSTGGGTYGSGSSTGTEECMEMKTPLPPQTRLTMVHQAEVVINQVGCSGDGLIGGRRLAYI